MNNPLKRFLPKGLYARALLILIVPLVLLQAITAYIFYERHWESVSRNLATHLGGEIALLVHQLVQTPLHKRKAFLESVNRYTNIEVTFMVGKDLKTPPGPMPEVYHLLVEAIRRHHDYPVVVREQASVITVEIGTEIGVLRLTASRKRLENPTTYIYLLWVVGAAVVLLAIGLLFLRNQIRPVVRLAEAAELFGRGLEMPNFRPTGAREVRQASAAFILMSKRIRRQIAQRTEMLAGISHDLRTPLTRMRLQLAMMPESEVSRGLLSDITEMEEMIQGYIAFAKGEGQEPLAPHDLVPFLTEIAEKYARQQHTVELALPGGAVVVPFRPQATERALGNVLDNAFRYGSRVRLMVEDHPEYVQLSVEDDGPGLPDDEKLRVFKPFYRVDKSRNRHTGGAGLGLSIARDIVRGQGGSVYLDDASLGGLAVIIRLPKHIEQA